jgi:hypothetical protein
MAMSLKAREMTMRPRVGTTREAGVHLDNAYDLGRRHCMWRNRAVSEVLVHLRALRTAGLLVPGEHRIRPLAPAPVSGIARMGVPPHVEAMLRELTLGDLERRRIRRTCFTSRLAHRLPCRLLIGDDLVTDLIRPSGPEQAVARAHFGGLFDLMDAVPTMFDEADSQPELSGFADAFVAACAIALSARVGVDTDADAVLDEAWRTWLSGATRAAENGAARHRRLLDEADFANRLYHHTKSELFQLYADRTRAESVSPPSSPAVTGMARTIWQVDA